jgi:hypothetical protein
LSDTASLRPLTVLVWVLAIATLLIGCWRLMQHGSRSQDQKILIDKSNAH